MKEVEILVEVLDSSENVLNKLKGFNYEGEKEIVDVYYFDPLKDNLKPNSDNQLNECLRLRSKDSKSYITYKKDHFEENRNWIYSDEYETKFESFEMMKEILERLGFKELLTIKNNKTTYTTSEYEIVFERVENLGMFLEVECRNFEGDDIKTKKKEIQDFINSLGIKVSEDLNIGKPELMLRKLKGSNK